MQLIVARGLVLLVVCWSVCGCGATELNRGEPDGETGGSGGGQATLGGGGATGGTEALSAADAMALFAQAPHCGTNTAYQLDGSIDGGMVHDGADDFVGGFTNGDSGNFTSVEPGFKPQPERVTINFEWRRSISYGQASAISNGTLIAPLGLPRAGERLCITRGVVGFPPSGNDEGNFKFWLRAARSGADCSGPPVAIDLRGCMN